MVPADLLDKIDAAKPSFLDRKGFLCLLLTTALDACGTLEKAVPAVTSSSTTSLLEEKKKESEFSETTSVRKGKGGRPTAAESKHLSPEFLAFWRTYQSCGLKAHGQSRKKAWEAWQQAVKQESPERLLEAARRAVEEVRRLTAAGMFCAPLPDAFRWLRDERYAVFLDETTAEPPSKTNDRYEYVTAPTHNPYQQRRPDGTIYAERPDGSTVELGTVEERERELAIIKLRSRSDFAAPAAAVLPKAAAESGSATA
jgi:hypothetical protein